MVGTFSLSEPTKEPLVGWNFCKAIPFVTFFSEIPLAPQPPLPPSKREACFQQLECNTNCRRCNCNELQFMLFLGISAGVLGRCLPSALLLYQISQLSPSFALPERPSPSRPTKANHPKVVPNIESVVNHDQPSQAPSSPTCSKAQRINFLIRKESEKKNDFIKYYGECRSCNGGAPDVARTRCGDLAIQPGQAPVV